MASQPPWAVTPLPGTLPPLLARTLRYAGNYGNWAPIVPILKIGSGHDIYQPPDDWFELGAHDMRLRECRKTNVDIYRSEGQCVSA